MHDSTLLAAQGSGASGTSTPITGAGKMAAAAKARSEGVVRKGNEGNGGGAMPEDETHPLSEKSLRSR
jgi:hypothetical protein